jgi:ribosomal-protein-alanine N-acetyltransferase
MDDDERRASRDDAARRVCLMTAPPAPPEAIELDGLALRRLTPEDAADLLAHFSDPQVTEFLDFSALTALPEAEAIIEWADQRYRSGRGIRWAIREAGGGSFVGTCGFNTIVREHGSRGEIAYDLGRRYWGRGIMRLVMPAVLDTGFRHLALHRLQAFVTPGNERSARLLMRHGFHPEGRLRGYGRWRGADWDQDIYALLEDEWFAA